MSAASRESTRGDAGKQSPTNNVVPVELRSQAFNPAEEAGELSGGGELSTMKTSTRQTIDKIAAASSQRTTRQSDLAAGLAVWDTRTSEPRPDETSLTTPPDFKPFFALVEDPVTGEYHHPEVHYVFSDDEDQGVLTHAALEAIDKEDNTLHEGEGTDERVAIIDMDYDGRTVLGSSSLSPEWQALRTEIWEAPGKPGGSRHGATERGLMLRVSGKEHGGRMAGEMNVRKDVDQLVQWFGSCLQELDEVLLHQEERDQDPDETDRGTRSQRPGSVVE
ncbi:hypothetical protein Q7P37_007359 [Cladosporium fusiforme]